jgi:hypothetical protein
VFDCGNLASRTRRAGETFAAASIAATFGFVCCERSRELRAYLSRNRSRAPWFGHRKRSRRLCCAGSVALGAASGAVSVVVRASVGHIACRANRGESFWAVGVAASVVGGKLVWHFRPNRSLQRTGFQRRCAPLPAVR